MLLRSFDIPPLDQLADSLSLALLAKWPLAYLSNAPLRSASVQSSRPRRPLWTLSLKTSALRRQLSTGPITAPLFGGLFKTLSFHWLGYYGHSKSGSYSARPLASLSAPSGRLTAPVGAIDGRLRRPTLHAHCSRVWAYPCCGYCRIFVFVWVGLTHPLKNFPEFFLEDYFVLSG